jgi:hypothetical protein
MQSFWPVAMDSANFKKNLKKLKNKKTFRKIRKQNKKLTRAIPVSNKWGKNQETEEKKNPRA